MTARADSPIYRRRLRVNRFNLLMSMATMAFGMVFLIWILVVLFAKGIGACLLYTSPSPRDA